MEAIIGVSVSATRLDSTTALTTVRESSTKTRPIWPGRKISGTNTATTVAVVAMTAKNTCRVPRIAASVRGSPSSMRRWMFSSTTIESSTTSPMTSTSASSVRMLIEKPARASTAKVATRQTGTTAAGSATARSEPRKR